MLENVREELEAKLEDELATLEGNLIAYLKDRLGDVEEAVFDPAISPEIAEIIHKLADISAAINELGDM